VIYQSSSVNMVYIIIDEMVMNITEEVGIILMDSVIFLSFLVEHPRFFRNFNPNLPVL